MVAETPIHDDCEGAFVSEAVAYIAASVLHKELQHAPSSEHLIESANRMRVESNPAWMTADGGREDEEDHLFELDSGALLIERP